jgi:hypothetical protein
VKKVIVHIILASFVLLLVTSCKRNSSDAIPDMSPSYAERSKKPMGAYTAYQMFKAQFPSYYVYKHKKGFKDVASEIEGSRNLYFIVADEFYVDKDEVEQMLAYVEDGNQLFIAASFISPLLLDTLKLDVWNRYNQMSLFTGNDNPFMMRRTEVRLTDTSANSSNKYGFFYYPLKDHFKKVDTAGAVVLGYGDNKKPNFITMPYGSGRIFLHLHPEVFSNYFLLKEKNNEYFEQLMSYMNTNRKTVYWSDYYRMGIYPEERFSAFRVFMKHKPLRWALFIAIFSLLTYLLLALIRRQRAIPVMVPNTNSSVSFVETIGRLYLQHKDHQNIVHKMVTYFLEKVRRHYYLNTSSITPEFISSLSKKSGVPETEVKSTFQYIHQLQEAPEIQDAQVLELHSRLLPFFKT